MELLFTCPGVMVNDNQKAAQDFQVVDHVNSGVFQSGHFLSQYKSVNNSYLFQEVREKANLAYYEGKQRKRKEEKSTIFFTEKKKYCGKTQIAGR